MHPMTSALSVDLIGVSSIYIGEMEKNMEGSNTKDTDRIWEEFSGRIRAHLLKKLRRKDDADDLMQEIFIKIYAHVGHLRERTKLSSWIYAMVENTLNDYYRKNGRREMKFDEGKEYTKTANVEDPLEGITGCLNAFIDRLPTKYRDPLVLSDLEGMKQKDIAERMHLSYSGLKSRVQRGREMIREMFVECCKLSIDEKGIINSEYQEMDKCTLCGDD